MLEVELIVQHCMYTATRSGLNGNKVVAGTASEASARWLQHGYMLLLNAGTYCFTARYLTKPQATGDLVTSFLAA